MFLNFHQARLTKKAGNIHRYKKVEKKEERVKEYILMQDYANPELLTDVIPLALNQALLSPSVRF